MIRFLRDAGGYLKGMTRELGTATEAAYVTAGDAVRVADGRVHVPAGTTSAPVMLNGRDVVVVAAPGSGGTMSAEATWSPASNVEAGDANWAAWDAGSVSAITTQFLTQATAVRFTATTAAGVGEVSR